MKIIQSLFIISLALFLSGCQNKQNDQINETSEIENSNPEIYTLFTINSHDWVLWEESAETINRVIDIHEQYEIPVDIYLTDPLVQAYVTNTPDLIERLKTSEFATVSYHIRPPSPYEYSFDFLGLDEMAKDELYQTLLNYEEHELDLETGMPNENPGGYEYLKSILGYAPPIVGMQSSPSIAETLAKIFIEKGATFQIIHNQESDFGRSKYGLQVRPENIEVKLYEYDEIGVTGDQVIDERLYEYLSENPDKKEIFINLKFHENNFYVNKVAWKYIYDNKKPPFDLNDAEIHYESEEK